MLNFCEDLNSHEVTACTCKHASCDTSHDYICCMCFTIIIIIVYVLTTSMLMVWCLHCSLPVDLGWNMTCRSSLEPILRNSHYVQLLLCWFNMLLTASVRGCKWVQWWNWSLVLVDPAICPEDEVMSHCHKCIFLAVDIRYFFSTLASQLDFLSLLTMSAVMTHMSCLI